LIKSGSSPVPYFVELFWHFKLGTKGKLDQLDIQAEVQVGYSIQTISMDCPQNIDSFNFE
jgi:hypothetical protein